MFKLLMIDDETNYTMAFKYLLEAKAGYSVIIAPSGSKGLEEAMVQSPDMIFLDVMMPGESGLDILKALKDDEKTKDIPVYMLSAVQTEKAHSEAKALGVEGFILKPFDTDLMMEKIEQIKARKEAS